MSSEMSFYLAASFPRRSEALEIAKEITRETDAKCTARWIHNTYHTYGNEGQDKKYCQEDLDDVRKGGFLVLLTDGEKQQSKGGRHTELGIALAFSKPVIIIGPKEQVFHSHPLCVFARDVKEACVIVRALKLPRVSRDDE